jgi:hypothetical protein
MAEHLRDKKVSVAILSNLQEDPSNKYGNGDGLRDGKKQLFFSLVLTSPAGRPITTICDRMRQLATLRRFATKHGQSRRSTATGALLDPTNETVPMGNGT